MWNAPQPLFHRLLLLLCATQCIELGLAELFGRPMAFLLCLFGGPLQLLLQRFEVCGSGLPVLALRRITFRGITIGLRCALPVGRTVAVRLLAVAAGLIR